MEQYAVIRTEKTALPPDPAAETLARRSSPGAISGPDGPATIGGRRPPNDDDGKIPVVGVETANLTPRESLEAYCDGLNNIYDISLRNDDTRRRGISVTGWHLGDLSLFEAWGPSIILHRSLRHIRQTHRDFVRLVIRRQFAKRKIVDGMPVTLDTAAIHLLDFSRDQKIIDGLMDNLTVYLPHTAIGYDPSRHPAYMRVGLETPAGRILWDAWSVLLGELNTLPASEAPPLAAGFSGLVRGLLMQDGPAEEARDSFQAARRRSMDKFIEEHLRDPNFGIVALAQAFGAARATIYRDFAPDGGLDRYIKRRRLERAYCDLVAQPATRGRVSQVAELWGFTSVSYFNRLFRAQFGCTPGAILLEDAKPATDRAKTTRADLSGFGAVNSWLGDV